ncbi:hypothetical protein AMTR_s00057p00099250 [Amborella trichopoda]|uniref:Uncharacterized protein n=1 Tax=Amborella trichopoda TaxID=13333 RepID=U5D303_AMBTC|nr:hypothetical protein AMTR_s00057p00099250 [Amborella trichopoda]
MERLTLLDFVRAASVCKNSTQLWRCNVKPKRCPLQWIFATHIDTITHSKHPLWINTPTYPLPWINSTPHSNDQRFTAFDAGIFSGHPTSSSCTVILLNSFGPFIMVSTLQMDTSTHHNHNYPCMDKIKGVSFGPEGYVLGSFDIRTREWAVIHTIPMILPIHIEYKCVMEMDVILFDISKSYQIGVCNGEKRWM